MSRRCGDEPPCEHEEVVEFEPPGLRPLARAVEHELADDRAEEQAALPANVVEQPLQLVTELELDGAQVLERGLATRMLLPVRLVARHRLPAGEEFVRGQDRFERDAEAGGVADLGGEGGGQGDRVLLFVAGRWDGCGDLVGQGERPVGVETQWPGIVERDAVVDEVPVRRGSPGRSGARRSARRSDRTRTARRTRGRRRRARRRVPDRRADGRAGRPTAPRTRARSRVRRAP